MNNKQGNVHIISEDMIFAYEKWMIEEEKSPNTRYKYLQDIKTFMLFLSGRDIEQQVVSKRTVIEYKEYLQKRYVVSSINSMLVALNSFLKYVGWNECCVKLIKCQRKMFREERRELSKKEYLRLVSVAKKNHKKRLSLVMETICSTGIRVSELKYVTAEAAKQGWAEITCKGKQRSIFLPKDLCLKLVRYAKQNNIASGCIFQTRTGRPLDRSNIWHDMKALCQEAGIEKTKVFPHNLRHLFAKTFYEIEKDIVRLSDILGHSNINTTRIYIIFSQAEHSRKMESLGLII
ncbi:MAG: tyrosine-type recombinase/integrase [Firmicutes bacterium]|jgi:integrase/recombinase XerD|nr:tyrosine-type recombinase/integrase [Bacillota bacterium]